MRRLRFGLVTLMLLATTGLAPLTPSMAQDDPREWLPATTLVYGRVASADQWLDHPLRQWGVETEPFKKIWRSPDVLKGRSALALGELAVGMKLEYMVRNLTVGGVHIALDSETQGAILLTRAKDAEWLGRLTKKLIDFANKDAESKGQPSPFRSAEYRGIQGYEVNKIVFATLGPWLMVTNRGELAKAVIDRHLDPELPSLADASEAGFATATSATDSASSATRWIAVDVDLEKARQAYSENDLFRKQAKDFGAELILGGILTLLQHSPRASLTLDAEPASLLAEISFPTEMEWFSETREHYVGPQASGRALPPLAVENSIAALSTYRNLSELWLRAGDLLNQEANDQLAQADSTLTTLFSGKDFGADILGAIEPEIRMTVVPQAFASDTLVPAVKLPGFAMVAKLKQPESMRRELKRIFQSFIGFLNVVGAMEGQPQLDLSSETIGESPVYWGEYVIDAEKKYENGLPIQFNFSPAMAFSGDHVVISSTVQLARQLLAGQLDPTATEGASPSHANTLLELNAEALRIALEPNRDAMIVQNMLEKGHSRTEASAEIGMLFNLLDLVRRASASLSFADRSTVQVRVESSRAIPTQEED